MKKYLCLFVALLIAITALSGCDFQMTMLPQNTISNTVPTTTEGTQPTEEPMAPTGGDPVEITLPEESFEMVNGVYATCENYDFTFYMGLNANTQPVIEFYLITEKPLPEDAAITIPGISAGYRADILDRSPSSSKEFLDGSNKVLYAFLTDPDLDFTAYLEEGRQVRSEYERLFTLVYGEDGRQPGENYPPDHPYAESFEQAKAALFSYDGRYQTEYEDYCATEPMPNFHIYKVKLFLTSVPEKEQIKLLTLAAGDMSREIPMKNVWIAPKPRDMNTKGVSRNVVTLDPNTGFWLGESTFTSVNSAGTFPFSSGVTGSTLYFEATKDITLNDLRPYGDNTRTRLEWVELAILSNKGTVVTAKWFPGTEMLIRKGEHVAMRIYSSEPYTELFSYGAFKSFVIDYRCDGEECQIVCGFSDFREPAVEMYPTYLQIVKGMDLSRYFREYFHKEQMYYQ